MFPIVATRHVARGIKLFEIKAPRIAKKQRLPMSRFIREGISLLIAKYSE